MQIKRWNVISKQQYLYDCAHLFVMGMCRELWHFLAGQGRQSTYKVNTEALSCNHCCSGKAISITYCQCVFSALGIHPACNAHAPYCHLWLARLYNVFPHYLIKGSIFGEKIIDHKSVFWFSIQLLSETFLVNDQLDALFLNVFISCPYMFRAQVLIIRRAKLY
jgi:hypothetical protein